MSGTGQTGERCDHTQGVAQGYKALKGSGEAGPIQLETLIMHASPDLDNRGAWTYKDRAPITEVKAAAKAAGNLFGAAQSR